ncbi:MAG TPA: hypothetical protein VFS66_13245 [Acidimicrobiia bacterium]|nr:hypothetical protein [Acidimicrobiia bacterium]
MVDDPHVVVDGVEVASPPSSPGSTRTVWISIGLLVVGIVAVIGLSTGSDPATVADESVLIERPRGPEADDVSLSAVVSGLDDALVGLSWTNDDELLRVLWPNSRGAVSGTLNAGLVAGAGETAFDVSGYFLAVVGPDPDTGEPRLLIGRHTGLQPAPGVVTSFAWHDNEPGMLSYTTNTGDGGSLWRVVSNFSPVEIASFGSPGWEVAAWGDWGYAMQAGDEVLLLTPDAEIKATRPGRALGSSRDGWILVASDELELVSAGGGVQRLDIPPDRMGTIDFASFAPNGESVAIAGSRGVFVFPLQGNGERVELIVGGPNFVTWSSDSRFLVVAMPSGVVVEDLETVNQYQILDDFMFQSLAMIPSTLE